MIVTLSPEEVRIILTEYFEKHFETIENDRKKIVFITEDCAGETQFNALVVCP